MNIKQLSIPVAAGTLSMWGLAGIWHEVIMVNFYTNEAKATHEGAGIILLAYFILNILYIYLYLNIEKKSYVIEGVKLGAIVGVLWVFPHELAMAGAHGDSMTYVFVNGIWHIIEQGFGGLVIGLVYGKLEKQTT